jgi:hypothetical protein
MFFQFLFPGLTLVSLLESEPGFENVTQLAETRKQPSSHPQVLQFFADAKNLVYMISGSRSGRFNFFCCYVFFTLCNWSNPTPPSQLKQSIDPL